MLDFDNLIPLGPDELANWGEGDKIFADTYYAWAFVNPQSGEAEYYPYFTLELQKTEP